MTGCMHSFLLSYTHMRAHMYKHAWAHAHVCTHTQRAANKGTLMCGLHRSGTSLTGWKWPRCEAPSQGTCLVGRMSALVQVSRFALMCQAVCAPWHCQAARDTCLPWMLTCLRWCLSLKLCADNVSQTRSQRHTCACASLWMPWTVERDARPMQGTQSLGQTSAYHTHQRCKPLSTPHPRYAACMTRTARLCTLLPGRLLSRQRTAQAHSAQCAFQHVVLCWRSCAAAALRRGASSGGHIGVHGPGKGGCWAQRGGSSSRAVG